MMSEVMELKLDAECKSEGFWSAVDVWLRKPQVVNKRLCGATETEYINLQDEQLEGKLSAFTSQSSAHILPFLYPEQRSAPGWRIGVRTLIPKVKSNADKVYKEVIVKDLNGHTVTFLPTEQDCNDHVVLKESNIYQMRLHSSADNCWLLSLRALNPETWHSDGVFYPKLTWLSSELLPKIARWTKDSKPAEFKTTLSLIPVEKYSMLYQELKNKYKEIVKVWPEVTDPEKFVFEDVAIATYLLILWEEERAEKGITYKQSFVDLGCGNGLLVHILNKEGHPGKGIDVRKRKIWDMYGSNTHLEEKAITPSAAFLFPDTDWLIGNHSDELTPWIPVIASRSSFSCRYFVLPCCFFDFCGKYQRRQCRKSQYREYIDFISEVSMACGFKTDEDCLRIPSTKRVCLIGKNRSYVQTEEDQAEEKRADYIRKRQALYTNVFVYTPKEHGTHQYSGEQNVKAEHEWGNGFQPREKIETMRNCAALPRNFIDDVVLKVATTLLGFSEETKEKAKEDMSIEKGTKWNPGGSLSLLEVAELLEHSTLQMLKKECGGLQTLLKNNHQVFKVVGGRVHIRDWRTQRTHINSKHTSRISGALKTRLCWFHIHHPHGCPLSTDDCVFAHGAGELRPSTQPLKTKQITI